MACWVVQMGHSIGLRRLLDSEGLLAQMGMSGPALKVGQSLLLPDLSLLRMATAYRGWKAGQILLLAVGCQLEQMVKMLPG